MSDTKALYDVVVSALGNWGNAEAQDAFKALMGRLRDAEKEREEDQGVIRVWRGRTERAEADNAALLAAISTYHEAWKTGRDGVPFAALLRTAHKPHPGAALLEELEGLRRQVDSLKESVELLRTDRDTAHNAALEEAAKVADAESRGWNDAYTKRRGEGYDVADRLSAMESVASDIAKSIRALKKTGQGNG